FLDYHTGLTNLRKDDKALYNDCIDFVDYIGSVQSMLSKQVNKEIVSKRHAMFMDKDVLSPRDCWAVASQCIFVLYYLEAIVILKHCQRPCVVENMKVAEWLGRKQESEQESEHTIIYVKDHKTAAHFVVGIALSKQEEEWFEKPSLRRTFYPGMGHYFSDSQAPVLKLQEERDPGPSTQHQDPGAPTSRAPIWSTIFG
ncbi:unnamed protein product, partial [Pleuronectes platessa]